MSNPTVSILLPYFNGKKFVKETIDSIINQSFGDFELLAIDDGSTSAEQSEYFEKLVESYKDPRLCYIHKHNEGLSATRNYGIDHAKGEFIAFIDQDDIWLPEKLAKQVAVFQTEPPAQLICTDVDVFGEHSVSKRISHLYGLKTGFVKDSFTKMLKGNFVAASSVAFRKKEVGAVAYSNKRYTVAPDYELFVRMAENNIRFYFISEPLLRYREHEENTIKNVLRLYWEQYSILFERKLTTPRQKIIVAQRFLDILLHIAVYGWRKLWQKE